jgi:hypothetical protein
MSIYSSQRIRWKSAFEQFNQGLGHVPALNSALRFDPSMKTCRNIKIQPFGRFALGQINEVIKSDWLLRSSFF